MNKLVSVQWQILLGIVLIIIESGIFWIIKDTAPFVIHGKTIEAKVTMVENVYNGVKHNPYRVGAKVHYSYQVESKVYENSEEIRLYPRYSWYIPEKDKIIKVVYHVECPNKSVIASFIKDFYGMVYFACIYIIFFSIFVLSRLKTQVNFITLELYITNLILTFYFVTILMCSLFIYWYYQAYNFSSSTGPVMSIVFLMLTIISLNGLMGITRKLKELKILKERGKPYKAYIVSNELGKFFYKIKYHYKLNDGSTFIGEKKKISNLRCKELKEGDIVDIVYDPINPSVSIWLEASASAENSNSLEESELSKY